MVTRLLIFVGMTMGGWLAWWLGDYLKLGLMWDFLLSMVGTAIGVYAGWKVGQDHFGD